MVAEPRWSSLKTPLVAAVDLLYSQDLLNNLFRHPYTRIEFVQQELNVSRPTATKYLDELAKSGLLLKHRAGRNNYYITSLWWRCSWKVTGIEPSSYDEIAAVERINQLSPVRMRRTDAPVPLSLQDFDSSLFGKVFPCSEKFFPCSTPYFRRNRKVAKALERRAIFSNSNAGDAFYAVIRPFLRVFPC